MLRYAIIFLIISIIAGAIGLTGVSAIAKRISLILFALFFVGFLLVLGFLLLVGEAVQSALPVPPPTIALFTACMPHNTAINVHTRPAPGATLPCQLLRDADGESA